MNGRESINLLAGQIFRARRHDVAISEEVMAGADTSLACMSAALTAVRGSVGGFDGHSSGGGGKGPFARELEGVLPNRFYSLREKINEVSRRGASALRSGHCFERGAPISLSIVEQEELGFRPVSRISPVEFGFIADD
jgi:hypothetical protein